jgi:hypothetical protein
VHIYLRVVFACVHQYFFGPAQCMPLYHLFSGQWPKPFRHLKVVPTEGLTICSFSSNVDEAFFHISGVWYFLIPFSLL